MHVSEWCCWRKSWLEYSWLAGDPCPAGDVDDVARGSVLGAWGKNKRCGWRVPLDLSLAAAFSVRMGRPTCVRGGQEPWPGRFQALSVTYPSWTPLSPSALRWFCFWVLLSCAVGLSHSTGSEAWWCCVLGTGGLPGLRPHYDPLRSLPGRSEYQAGEESENGQFQAKYRGGRQQCFWGGKRLAAFMLDAQMCSLGSAKSDPPRLAAGEALLLQGSPSPCVELFTYYCCHHLAGLRGLLFTLFSAQAPKQAMATPNWSKSGTRLECLIIAQR